MRELCTSGSVGGRRGDSLVYQTSGIGDLIVLAFQVLIEAWVGEPMEGLLPKMEEDGLCSDRIGREGDTVHIT